MFRVAFFDSGPGGIFFGSTVMKRNYNKIRSAIGLNTQIEIVHIYDNLNAPYHLKSLDNIIRIGNKALKMLNQENADISIIACNTLSCIVDKLTIPDELKNKLYFVTDNSAEEVINLCNQAYITNNNISKARIIDNQTKVPTVLLFATKRTIDSQTYQKLISKIWKEQNNKNSIYIKAFSPLWSGYIQDDFEHNSTKWNRFIQDEFKNFLYEEKRKDPNFYPDVISLYCTHFILYSKIFQNILNDMNIKCHIVSQGHLFDKEIDRALNIYLSKKVENNKSKTEDNILKSNSIVYITEPSSENIKSTKKISKLLIKLITTSKTPDICNAIQDIYYN